MELKNLKQSYLELSQISCPCFIKNFGNNDSSEEYNIKEQSSSKEEIACEDEIYEPFPYVETPWEPEYNDSYKDERSIKVGNYTFDMSAFLMSIQNKFACKFFRIDECRDKCFPRKNRPKKSELRAFIESLYRENLF